MIAYALCASCIAHREIWTTQLCVCPLKTFLSLTFFGFFSLHLCDDVVYYIDAIIMLKGRKGVFPWYFMGASFHFSLYGLFDDTKSTSNVRGRLRWMQVGPRDRVMAVICYVERRIHKNVEKGWALNSRGGLQNLSSSNQTRYTA